MKRTSKGNRERNAHLSDYINYYLIIFFSSPLMCRSVQNIPPPCSTIIDSDADRFLMLFITKQCGMYRRCHLVFRKLMFTENRSILRTCASKISPLRFDVPVECFFFVFFRYSRFPAILSFLKVLKEIGEFLI